MSPLRRVCPPNNTWPVNRAWPGRILFFYSLSLGLVGSVCAQDISAHRWEDRVLLLYTRTTEAPAYRKQVRALLEDQEGLQERRLVVYTIFKDRFARGLPPSQWQEGLPAGLPARKADTEFGLMLLGLDGGIKRESQDFVPLRDLWAQIDGMPMRQAEIRNKGKQ